MSFARSGGCCCARKSGLGVGSWRLAWNQSASSFKSSLRLLQDLISHCHWLQFLLHTDALTESHFFFEKIWIVFVPAFFYVGESEWCKSLCCTMGCGEIIVLTQGHRAVLARWHGSQGTVISHGVLVGDCGKCETCRYAYTLCVVYSVYTAGLKLRMGFWKTLFFFFFGTNIFCR